MRDEVKTGAGPGVGAAPKYSIVIPAYNESARIPATLESVVGCIRARGWNAEVLVVNDGSTDKTAEVVREIARNAPEIRLIENPTNRGKGYSVRKGMLEARGQIALFTDSDLSAPIEEAERLFAAIAEGADSTAASLSCCHADRRRISRQMALPPQWSSSSGGCSPAQR